MSGVVQTNIWSGDDWVVEFAAAGDYGLTWVASDNEWWMTDDKNSNPRLFRLSESGSVLNNYNGYSTECRGITNDDSTLYGVSVDDKMDKVSLTTGSSFSEFNLSGGSHGGAAWDYDSSLLYINEDSDDEFKAYTTGGTAQTGSDIPYPASLTSVITRDCCYDGNDGLYLTVLNNQTIYRINSSGVIIEEILGPSTSNTGIEMKDGVLYVNSNGSVYRRVVG